MVKNENVKTYTTCIIMTEISVGDRVTKINDSYYPNLNFSGKKVVPIGTLGTVMRLRKRYEHTPNFYILYIVHFDGYDFDDELMDQYDSSSLQLTL